MMNTKGKVLIVDDNSTHLFLLQTILQDEGFETVISDNSKKVSELMTSNDFQLLLLDIMMPGMDGFQVLQEIKEKKELSNLVVIVISAKTDSWSIKNALDLGANDYITKPINVQDVKNKVKSAMSA